MSLYVIPQISHLDQARVLLLGQTPDVALPGSPAVVDEGVGEELRGPPVVDGDLPGDERQPEAELGQQFRRPGPGAKHLEVSFLMPLSNQFLSRDVPHIYLAMERSDSRQSCL